MPFVVIRDIINLTAKGNFVPEFKHYTVMKNEAVDALHCRSGLIYVDATLGGGGHSELILKKIQPGGSLIAFDVDEEAVIAAKKRLKDYKNLTIVQNSYANITKVLQDLNIEKITGGIIFDLGASYYQLTQSQRGFSFLKDAPLDMRFNKQADFSAYDLVNTYSEKDLVRIFSEYGQERFSKRIAKKIIMQRKVKRIATTGELVNLIFNCTPRIKSAIHPATRVFQAIRIEVNQELTNVKNTFEKVFHLLGDGAIISVISFHSLEDRIIKTLFREYSQKCRCTKNQLICTCKPPILETVTKKPVVASEKEVKENPPSRSAKLRIARRVSNQGAG